MVVNRCLVTLFVQCPFFQNQYDLYYELFVGLMGLVSVIESVSQKPTTPSSVQIEVVSSLLTDDMRPDTPQSTSSMASSPRDSPPPPPLSPPPPLMHVTKPQVDIDQDHATSVITAARNVCTKVCSHLNTKL
jgi:hypothetical protein